MCHKVDLFFFSSCGVLALMSFQESPDSEKSCDPKMQSSGCGGSELSASSGSSSKPGGAPVVTFVPLPSKPVVKLDPLSPSAVSKPSVSGSSLSMGDRAPIRRPASPMEALMGSPRRYGDGSTRSTTHLTSSDLLRGPKPYQ